VRAELFFRDCVTVAQRWCGCAWILKCVADLHGVIHTDPRSSKLADLSTRRDHQSRHAYPCLSTVQRALFVISRRHLLTGGKLCSCVNRSNVKYRYSDSCPVCRNAVHAICGTPFAEDDEGFGQRRWCSKTEACSKVVLASFGESCIRSSCPDSDCADDSSLSLSASGSESLEIAHESFVIKPVPVEKPFCKKLSQDQKQAIIDMKRANPMITQKDLIAWFGQEYGYSLSQSTISDVLKKGRENVAKGNLNLDNRKKICQEYVSGPKRTQKQLALWAKDTLNLDKEPAQSVISEILKNKQRYLVDDLDHGNAKRSRIARHPQLDVALANWVLQSQHRNFPINGPLIQTKAKQLASKMEIPDGELSFSKGWLEKFLERYSFRHFKVHGESGSADVSQIARTLPDLKRVISRFEPRDVYNMDETGLFYCLNPSTTIARSRIEGKKKDKTRITIAFTSNADGTDKLEPLFLGRAFKPRAFGKKTAAQLGFSYDNNQKAWMTAIIFQKWVLQFDSRMRTKGRKVLLLLDNAPSHIVKNVELTNTTIVFFPPNATSKLQPMDAGIIAAFKRRYRQYHLENALARDENGEREDIFKVNQLQAMEWSLSAWETVSSTCIQNCFRHTGLFGSRDNESNRAGSIHDVESAIDNNLSQLMNSLKVKDPVSVTYLLNCPEENHVHQDFTDEELIAASKQIEVEEEDEFCDTVPEIVPAKELLPAIRLVMRAVEQNPKEYPGGLTILRRIQRDTVLEMQARAQQTDIRSFFAPRSGN
jgi:hypothetical protein